MNLNARLQRVSSRAHCETENRSVSCTPMIPYHAYVYVYVYVYVYYQLSQRGCFVKLYFLPDTDFHLSKCPIRSFLQHQPPDKLNPLRDLASDSDSTLEITRKITRIDFPPSAALIPATSHNLKRLSRKPGLEREQVP
jgi:hypothetical protein